MSIVISYFKENTPEIKEILDGYGYSLSDTAVSIEAPRDGSNLLTSFIKTRTLPSEDAEIEQALSFVPGLISNRANRN